MTQSRILVRASVDALFLGALVGCASNSAPPVLAQNAPVLTTPEPVTQEIDQRTRGQFPFGAPSNIALKTTAYPVPTGAIFVAPDGKDDGAGTLESPLSVKSAVAKASEGATIVFRGGVYRGIDYLNIDKRLTLQAYPRETPHIKGSKLLSGLQRDENGPLAFRIDDQKSAGEWKGDKQDISRDFPLSGLRDMAFLDGIPLRQVAKREEVAPGTFYADSAAQRVFFGDDPSGKSLEWATAYRAFNIGGTQKDAGKNLAAGTIVRGLNFSHFAYAALKVDWTRDVTLENNVAAWNSVAGVSIYNVKNCTVRGNTLACNGMQGLNGNNADGLLLEKNEIHHNNVERFWPGWSASGAKMILSRDMVWRDNIVRQNFAHGLWWDISIKNCSATGNVVTDNDGKGVMVELGDDCVVAFNTLARNEHGVAIWDSSDVRVWNNTLAFNTHNLEVNDTTRLNGTRDGEALGWGESESAYDEGVTWRTERLEIVNNVFAGARELEINGALSKWRPIKDVSVASWFSRVENNVFAPRVGSANVAKIYFASQNAGGQGADRGFASLGELSQSTGLATQITAKSDALFQNAAQGDFRLRAGVAPKTVAAVPADIAKLAGRAATVDFLGAVPSSQPVTPKVVLNPKISVPAVSVKPKVVKPKLAPKARPKPAKKRAATKS